MSDVTLSQLASYARKFNSAAGQVLGSYPDLVEKAQESIEAARPSLDAIIAAAPQPDQAVLDASAVLEDAQMKEFFNKVLGGNGDETGETAGDPAAEEAAKATVIAFNEKAAPSHIQLQEALASLIVNVLPADERDSVVPDEIRNADISAGFAAQNAPVLAAAFAPKP